MLGVIAAFRIGQLLGNGWIGCLAALFLILTPRYYGHAFNNHKDIPFAVAYLWSIFWLIRCLPHFPHIPRPWLIYAGLSLGITMGIRVGGMLLYFYLALFYGLLLLQATFHRPSTQCNHRRIKAGWDPLWYRVRCHAHRVALGTNESPHQTFSSPHRLFQIPNSLCQFL